MRLGDHFCDSIVIVVYGSRIHNISASRFLYGTGEEHMIRLLLKSKDNIANIFLN